MTDQEYISAMQLNDQKGIARMYAHFRSATLGYLRKHTTLDDDDIRDVYQEALIVLVDKASEPSFRLTSGLSTYVISVARYVAMNRMRKGGHMVSLDADEAPVHRLSDDGAGQQEAIEQEEQYGMLRHIITEMGEPCQSLLKAFYWEDLSYEEIAQKLPNYSTADSARNNKSRCVSKLRLFYEKLTS